ncbi:acyl carrier protein [Pseudodesulfovibrio methanolicus]|uniref:Carrier domain-containing protein n=1 Tax=Pseudodesulfovibrio methanolicus TaxID=3126690 RepID=A0ABZ2IXS3_9BACT
MPQQSIREIIVKCLKDVAELDAESKPVSISDNMCPFKSLGLCSEDGMLVTLEVEAQLGQDFGDENLFVDGKGKNGKRRTVGQMVKHVEELIKKAEGSNG